MSLHRAWILLAGVLLLVGTFGCGEIPGSFEAPAAPSESNPVAEVKVVAEPEAPQAVAQPEPSREEAKQSPDNPELTQDVAVAAIQKAGGRVEYDYWNRETKSILFDARLQCSDTG